MIADWMAAHLSPAPDAVWEFGGPLAPLPPETAWRILLGVALAGALWIAASYTWALVRPPRPARAALALIRISLWLVLVWALAGPTLVERRVAPPPPPRPVAVLVDRSASMMARDHRGQARLDDALRRWRKLAPPAHATGAPHCFAFAEKLAEVAEPETVPVAWPNGQTRLFGALQEVLARAPAGGWGGVVTLTDGRETVATDAGGQLRDTARMALAAGTPLHFVPGRNAEPPAKPFFVWRELAAPLEVPPKSAFTLTLTADSFQTSPGELPLRLTVGGQPVPAAPLFVNAGHRTAFWQAEIRAEAPGPLTIVLESGAGEERSTVRTIVNVGQPAHPTRILYHEGAPDWNRRFLADILRRDPAFEFSSMSRVDAAGRAVIRTPGLPKELPSEKAGYAGFDLVILASTPAGQLSAAQQRAIADWVGGGGALLCIAPDERAATDYSGSELERLFPVVFPARPAALLEDAATRAFRERMVRLGASDSEEETEFAQAVIRTGGELALVPFAWEQRGRELFAGEGATPTPVFSSFAPIGRVKAGAEVLARHPRATIPGTQERAVLLALQRYGRGQVAVLACDALWRWKLQEPSKARAVEQFWQHLLAWLGRDNQPRPSLSFPRAPLSAEVGREVVFEVAGRDAPPVRTTAACGDGAPVELVPGRTEGNSSHFRWTPPRAGIWTLDTRDGAGLHAFHWIDVRTTGAQPTGELSGLPADLGTLELLAGQTGGAVLGEVAPAAWGAPTVPPQVVAERHVPLWHDIGVFWLLLGLFAGELLVRRAFRLL